MRRAAARAFCTAGSNNATSTPMMAITTNNSIKVKPRARRETERMETSCQHGTGWDEPSQARGTAEAHGIVCVRQSPGARHGETCNGQVFWLSALTAQIGRASWRERV